MVFFSVYLAYEISTTLLSLHSLLVDRSIICFRHSKLRRRGASDNQRPNDITCSTNEANLGYQQLITVLNSDPETSVTQADLK
jgi:hypothetical protein